MPWVHFNESSFNTTNDSVFWTAVELDPSDMVSNISYFWGAQFDVVYDPNLIAPRTNGRRPGSLYDLIGANWTESDYDSETEIEPGRVRIQVDWRDYPSLPEYAGITTNGGTLIYLKWRATTNTGVTNLDFVEFKALVGMGPLPAVEWEITPVLWTNSSVTVQ